MASCNVISVTSWLTLPNSQIVHFLCCWFLVTSYCMMCEELADNEYLMIARCIHSNSKSQISPAKTISIKLVTNSLQFKSQPITHMFKSLQQKTLWTIYNTYSLNFGEHTIATASGSSFWYGQCVCWSTLERNAVCVGCVCIIHTHTCTADLQITDVTVLELIKIKITLTEIILQTAVNHLIIQKETGIFISIKISTTHLFHY